MAIHENEKKYVHPPDWETIRKFIKKLKVSMAKFERLYGIPQGIIRSVKAGYKPLPVRYWHIIYDRVPPPMVVKEAERLIKKANKAENVSKIVSEETIPPTAPTTPVIAPESPIQVQKNPSPSHDRLRFLKKK